VERLKSPASRLGPVGLAFLLVLLLLALQALVQPTPLTWSQTLNLLKIAAVLGLLSIGQTLVVLSGGEGVDLSVGAVATLGAIVVYNFTRGQDALFFPALALALLVGLGLGALNGILIVHVRLPPLVATLGLSSVVLGLILWVGGRERGEVPPLLVRLVSEPWVLGIPGVIFLWAFLGFLVTFLLRRTLYGKALYALGANRTAARLSGIPVEAYVVWTYALAGLFNALGGVILLGHVQLIHLTLGQAYTLPSVIAVVAGGTSLSGGVGGYGGTVAGALLITLLQSVLLSLRVEEFGRQVAFGLILLALLAFYGRGRPLRQ
jgi:ribose transport system permease protein